MNGKGALTEPVQLIRAQRAGKKLSLEVCEAGAAALERYGSRPIAVASVCGPYRSGKSYLLNLLAGRVQSGLPLAGVGNTTNACTEGLWLWGCSDPGDSGAPVLALLDCEGFGSPDRDRSHDAKLLTLCALLSSVLVLNTKGTLDTQQFGNLALATRFAQHVEESGCKASWPSLMWVLRDFCLELADEQGAPISADEYLERSLRDGAEEHRGVKGDILRFFARRSCRTLVRPAAEEEQLQALDSLSYEELRPEFQEGFQEVQATVMADCNAFPKTAGGQQLGCSALVALARRVVSTLNEDGVISLRGAWEAVQHDTCGSLADELRDKGCSTLRTLRSGAQLEDGASLPMSDVALAGLLARLRKQLREQWDQRALGGDFLQREYWQELEASISHEEDVVRAQNLRVGDLQLEEALRAWQLWVIDPSGTWEVGEQLARRLKAQMERTPTEPLARGAGVALEAAGRRLVSARGALVAAQASRAEGTAQEVEAASAELRRLASEREAQEQEITRLRSELEAREAARGQEQQLEVELERRKKSREQSMSQLLESQRKTGQLEGQVQVMQQEVDHLRERVGELQQKVAHAEGERALHEAQKEKMQQDLEEAATSAEKWREQAAEWKIASQAGAVDDGHGPKPVEERHTGKPPPACCSVQ